MTDEPTAGGRFPLLIAGLGNVLLRDDGIGVHAVRALGEEPLPGSRAVEVGTAVLDALHLFEAAGVVLALDAIQAGEPPGTIYEVRPDGSSKRARGSSLHEVDLAGAVAMLPPGRRPRVVVLGVEPAVIDYGLELSETVQAALPRFLETVRATAVRLLEDSGCSERSLN